MKHGLYESSIAGLVMLLEEEEEEERQYRRLTFETILNK
jgi:hypothetical protein